MEDHTAGALKLIGDPATRYREDPVRMIRAVRFAVKLGFAIDPASEKPIGELSHLLKDIPAARLYEEALKLFLSGKGVQTFEMLRHYDLFSALFPQADQCLNTEEDGFPKLFIAKALENSDKRIAEKKSVTPYFLLSAFLWEPVQSLAKEKMDSGDNESFAYQNAASEVLSKQVKSLSIPKRVTQSMRDVWLLQSRLYRRTGSKPFRLLAHPRFRAAYDFLLLRAETGGADMELAQWWTKFQHADESEQKKMVRPKNKQRNKKRKTNNAKNSQPSHND